MVNEIKLKTKLLNHYDDKVVKDNLVLETGEIAFQTVKVPLESGESVDAVLMKVGNGEATFDALDYVAATAADVYGWAKEAGLSVTSEGSGNVVASVSWDSANDTLKVIKTNAVTPEELEAVSSLIGTLPTTTDAKTIVEYINKKTEGIATSGALTELSNKVTAVETAISKLDDTYATDAALNAVKKTAEDATTVSEVDAQIVAKINALKEEDLWDAKGDAAKAQAAAEATAAADAASKANKAYNDAKAYTDGLADNYEVAGAAAIAEQNAKAYADGLADNYDVAGAAATAEQKAKDYADEIKADLLGDDLENTFNTLKAVQDWVNEHGEAAADLTEGLAEETRLRTEADNALSARIKAYEDAKNTYATTSDLDEVSKVANAAQTATQVSNAINAKIEELNLDTRFDNDYDAKGAADTALEAAKADAKSKADAAESNAKTHATNLNTAMDTRVKALENIDHNAYKAADTALHTTISAEIDADVKTLADGAVKDNADAIAAINNNLKSAAYTESSAYATAAQGEKADTAVQTVKVLGQSLTQASNELTVAQAKTALGLGSAAYTASTNYATAAQGLKSATAGDGLVATFKNNALNIAFDSEFTFILDANIKDE